MAYRKALRKLVELMALAQLSGKSYFYIFNFLPYRHEFSNWTVTGVDAQYEPDNWAKAINSTNFRRAFLYAINPSVTARDRKSVV